MSLIKIDTYFRPDSVRWLITQGVNVNDSMLTGWTAAHAAAKRGHLNIIVLLEEFGADKSAKAQHKDFGSEYVTYQNILKRKQIGASNLSSMPQNVKVKLI